MLALALAPTTITEQQQQRRRKPRILLGIFTILDIPSERQRRHLIWNTYLTFDKVHRTNTPNCVCSLQDLSSKKELVDNEDCQLVYTFVLSGNPNNNGTSSLEFNETYPLTIDPSLIDNHEQDVIYLNVPETNRVGKLWAWYHFCATSFKDRQEYLSSQHNFGKISANGRFTPTTSVWRGDDLNGQIRVHRQGTSFAPGRRPHAAICVVFDGFVMVINYVSPSQPVSKTYAQ